MKIKAIKSPAITGLLIAALAGCAGTKPDTDASHTNDPMLKTALQQGVAEPTIDSNGQTMSDAVKSALIESFVAQAKKDGIHVSPSGAPVKVTIQEYSTRSTVARFVLGVLAGQDHIKARVDVAGTSYEVEDAAHLALTGIDVVAKDVGVEAANGIAGLAGLPIVTAQKTSSVH